MERLEPVLKQKFWILLGVTLIMAIVGWWLSTAALAKTIAERQASIDAAFKKVPEGAVPNENWVKELNALNNNQQTAIAMAKSASWKQQRDKMMQWPNGIQPSSYWGKFSTVARDQIRQSYTGEVRRVWKSLDPFDPEDIEGTGVVFYPEKKMYEVLRKRPWQSGFKVEDETVWQIKEDLWLVERLFQSIVAVNGGLGVTQSEAVLHTIDHLELRGGGGPKPVAGSGGGSGGAGRGGGGAVGRKFMMVLNSDRDADDAASETTGAETYTPAPIENVSAEFDPAEELGGDGSSGAQSMGSEATETASAVIKRYVQDDDGLPYKTRGFYLSVKMDHRRIPALIAELTANENTILPIEVMRVQMARLYEDSVSKYTPPSANAVPTRTPMTSNNSMTRMMRPVGSEEDEPTRMNLAAKAGMNSSGLMSAEDRAIQARQAEISQAIATYEKVIADPAMAQVTICGVFILFKKVDDVAPPTAAPTPKETAAATPPADTKTEPDAQADSSAATDDNAAVPTETPMTDAAASDASSDAATPASTEADANAAAGANSESSGTEEAGATPKETEQEKSP